MIEIGLQGLKKIRSMVRTTHPFPEHRFSAKDLRGCTKEENIQQVRDEERLVVRSKYITTYDNAAKRMVTYSPKAPVYPINVRRKHIEVLTEEECTPGFYLSKEERRLQWRGETVLGGSGTTFQSPVTRGRPSHGNVPRSTFEFKCDHCGKEFREAIQLFLHNQERHQLRTNDVSVIVISDEEDVSTDYVRSRLATVDIGQNSGNHQHEARRQGRSGVVRPQMRSRCYTFGDCCKLLTCFIRFFC